MPYAILVSVFGAIIATAIAIFGLHSLSALKMAPFVGALLGASFSLATLEFHGLPWRATLNEYRRAAGVQSFKDVSTIYVGFAFGAAIVVSLVEVVGLIFDPVSILSFWSIGWVVIVGYTFWRAWRIEHPASFGRLDIFQTCAGAACLAMAAFTLYGPFDGSVILHRGASGFQLIKVIFVMNLWIAMPALAIALIGVNILRRLSRAAGLQ